MFNFDEVMQVFSEELRKAEIAFADATGTMTEEQIKARIAKLESIARTFKDGGGFWGTAFDLAFFNPVSGIASLIFPDTDTRKRVEYGLQSKDPLFALRYRTTIYNKVMKEIRKLEEKLPKKEIEKKEESSLTKESEAYFEKEDKRLKAILDDDKTKQAYDEYKLVVNRPDYALSEDLLAIKKNPEKKMRYEAYQRALNQKSWNQNLTNEDKNKYTSQRKQDEDDQKAVQGSLTKANTALGVLEEQYDRMPDGNENGTQEEKVQAAAKVKAGEQLNQWKKLVTMASEISDLGGRREALQRTAGTLNALGKDAVSDSKTRLAFEKQADDVSARLSSVIGALSTSKTEEASALVDKLTKGLQPISGETPQQRSIRISALLGEGGKHLDELEAFHKIELKSNTKGLEKEALKKELAELAPTDRVDVLLDVAKTPEGKRMGATAMLKKELENSFGKEVADNLTNYMYSTKREGQINESKLLSVVNRLERAKDQLDNTDWKDSKHKESILLEVASNPMFGDKIVDKYKNYKPESEEEANKYFAQAGKAAQSRLDLDLLTEKQRTQEASKIFDPDLINQIAKKREEIKGFEKELKGDTSELDKLGSKAANLSKAIQTMQTSIAQDMQSKDKRMSPIKLVKLRNSVVESKKELASIKKEMEPLAKAVLEDQKWLPPSEQNQYAKAVIQAAPAKEPARVVSTKPPPSKTPNEIQSEKEENKPIVAKLKETWLDKIKSEPTFIQDKVKSKLASIGDLSNDEFQMAQQNLQEIVSERIPLPAKNVAQIEGLPEMTPETSTAAQLAKSVEARPESISGEAVPEPQLATQAPEGEVAPEEQAPVQTADNKTLEETQAKANQIVELNKQLASLTEALSTAVDEKAKRDLATQIAAIEQQLNNLKGV